MSVTKENLPEWILQALRAQGGKARLIDVAGHIWDEHEDEIRTNRKLLLKWQHDRRGSAPGLGKQGLMKSNDQREPWELTELGLQGSST